MWRCCRGYGEIILGRIRMDRRWLYSCQVCWTCLPSFNFPSLSAQYRIQDPPNKVYIRLYAFHVINCYCRARKMSFFTLCSQMKDTRMQMGIPSLEMPSNGKVHPWNSSTNKHVLEPQPTKCVIAWIILLVRIALLSYVIRSNLNWTVMDPIINLSDPVSRQTETTWHQQILWPQPLTITVMSVSTHSIQRVYTYICHQIQFEHDKCK